MDDEAISREHPNSEGDTRGEAGGEGEEEASVVVYSRQQRFALPGEPICVICNRFGECILRKLF